MMKLLLIRHTTPAVEPGICYGQTDLDVNGSFLNESEAIKKVISDFEADAVFTSPLIRCSKLAQELFPNKAITEDKQLKEMNFGKWENKKWTDIPKAEVDTWANNFLFQGPPAGESFGTFIKRINSFESSILSSDHSDIAIVTHSGVIRSFLMKYLEIPAEKIFNLHLHYGAVISIEIHSEQYSQVKFVKG